MRNLIYTSALLSMVGCGISEDKFNEEFAAKYCEEQAICNPEMACGDATGTTTTGTVVVECDFDKAAAKDCLNGTWSCNDDFPGFEFAVPPSVCGSVCGAATTGTTTTTETTTTTTAGT